MNPSQATEEPWTWRRGTLQAAILSAVMFSALGLYLTILWWRGPAARICTQTSLDEHIPFRPAWVWIYMIPYVLGPLAAALMRWDTLMWYLRRGIPVVLISNAIFIMLPTRTAEHPIHEVTGDDLTSRLYRNMAEADGPAANAAPSLHVSLSCLLAVALTRNWPRWWWAWVLSTALVVMSTLFTWQHHLIDVATGAAVGGLAALPWRTLLGRRPPIPLAPAFF